MSKVYQANIGDVPILVFTSAERDARFASLGGAGMVRVQNLETGYYERFDGQNWLQEGPTHSAGPVISVRAKGAKGDGVTNDAGAIQAAINAAGVGGRVVFPPGKYFCGGTQLTGQIFQRWEGSYQLGTGGLSGSDGRTALIWGSGLGANNGVVAGVNQVFSRILFQGAAKNVTTGAAVSQGTTLQANHSKYEWCQFYDWGRGATLTNAFYASFETCEWARCGIGVYADTCYNLHFYNPTFRCGDNVFTNTNGTAIFTTNTIRHLTIHGGSIESYNSSGGIVVSNSGLVDLFGVYSEAPETGNGGFFVTLNSDDTTLNIIGCIGYLTEISRWVNASGRNRCNIFARGNYFVCSGASTTTPTAYVLPTNGTGGYVDIAGDSWADVALAGASYVGGSLNAGPVANIRVVVPQEYNNFANQYEFLGRAPVHVKRAAAPATAMVGAFSFADRTNWNPANAVSADPYAVFYDGTRWNPIRPAFTGSKTYDPPSLAAGSWTTALTTVTVTGAALGDKVQVTFSLDTLGVQFFGRATSGSTVTVDAWNPTGGAIDLASGTLTAVSIRY